jgi:FkbM family methyltransferase
VIGFEPLLDRVRERETSERGGNVELLPYAVGDGSRQVLYVNNEDATSSVFPLNVDFNAQFEHVCGLRTLKQGPIETKRLDDVLPPGPVDFLKLDVQGAELMVLQGAEQTLRRTAVIHCEVEFAPIYAGQPLYCEIHSFLVSHGFALIDLLVSHRYSYIVPSGRNERDRLLWGDAVFFREEADPAMLLAQALAALLVYRKPTLSEHLLSTRDAMTGETLARLFQDACPKV